MSSAFANREVAKNFRETLPQPKRESSLLNDSEFRRMLAIERKRSERTDAPFLLMLAECGDSGIQDADPAILEAIGNTLLQHSRDTDIIGWYQEGVILGALFTGLEANQRNSVLGTVAGRMRMLLESNLTSEEWRQVRLGFHLFPDHWDLTGSDHPGDSVLYMDLTLEAKRKKTFLVLKRVIDFTVSALLLAVCSPLFLLIALAIKATSMGPVFFRQKRIGQHGKQFIFLKFRSMYAGSNEHVHKKFVTSLITDRSREDAPDIEDALDVEIESQYKIKDDARITRLGRFLRKTSLDELPQLLNVLKGEMSLVGPRPAIPYEVEVYQTWHRHRVLAAKPGITGIWQVTGRSRVKFDEMVRMDLRYAMAWSLWLDLKILLQTPFAVIRGTGAF